MVELTEMEQRRSLDHGGEDGSLPGRHREHERRLGHAVGRHQHVGGEPVRGQELEEGPKRAGLDRLGTTAHPSHAAEVDPFEAILLDALCGVAEPEVRCRRTGDLELGDSRQPCARVAEEVEGSHEEHRRAQRHRHHREGDEGEVVIEGQPDEEAVVLLETGPLDHGCQLRRDCRVRHRDGPRGARRAARQLEIRDVTRCRGRRSDDRSVVAGEIRRELDDPKRRRRTRGVGARSDDDGGLSRKASQHRIETTVGDGRIVEGGPYGEDQRDRTDGQGAEEGSQYRWIVADGEDGDLPGSEALVGEAPPAAIGIGHEPTHGSRVPRSPDAPVEADIGLMGVDARGQQAAKVSRDRSGRAAGAQRRRRCRREQGSGNGRPMGGGRGVRRHW